MWHYVGLDVSVRHTSICIVDDSGRILRETRVSSDPAAIVPILTLPGTACRRVGLEAGPLNRWLLSGLAEAGPPVICVETRPMKAALAARVNKADRNDARGIAQMMRVGLYRPVHVKTAASQEKRTLPAARKLLQGQNRASRTTSGMYRRETSINDVSITEAGRRFLWPAPAARQANHGGSPNSACSRAGYVW